MDNNLEKIQNDGENLRNVERPEEKDKERKYKAADIPYRQMLEGEFSSLEERMNALREYAREAEVIYKKYKDNPEEIEDEEVRSKFKQYETYQVYGSSTVVTDVFRYNLRGASKLAFSLEKAGELGLPKRKIQELKLHFAAYKTKTKRMIEKLGPLLEYAHRTVLRKEKPYFREFRPLSKEEQKLVSLLDLPVGETETAHEIFSATERTSRFGDKDKEKLKNEAMHLAEARDYVRLDNLEDMLENPAFLASLKEMSEESGEDEDLIRVAEDLLKTQEKEEEGKEKPYRNKEEIEEELKKVSSKLDGLWEKDIIRRLSYEEYLSHLIKQDQFGEPSLDIPRQVRLMNDLARWERRHNETPIGGVLIGPPGTGKSLGIERYLALHPDHREKGPPIIVDMSQETTEFVLLGGEQVDVADKGSTVKMLSSYFEKKKSLEDNLGSNPSLTDSEKEKLSIELSAVDQHIEDLVHSFLGKHVEARKKAEKIKESVVDDVTRNGAKELSEEVKEQKIDSRAKKEIENYIKDSLVEWESKELGKVVYGNGWRDGIILKAIKEGRDIIINEYNNFRLPPDALRQLFQTPQGNRWFFTGTGSSYPVNSRIYLTANKGTKSADFFYDTADVSAAIGSRLPPPIELGYPDNEEEMLIMEAKLSDTKKEFLPQKDLVAQLSSTEALEDLEFNLEYNETEIVSYLFKNTLPKLRSLAKKYPGEIPSLDLRHIDRFCRELVNPYTRERNNTSVEEAFVKNFILPFRSDDAAWEYLVKENILIGGDDALYDVGLLHGKLGSFVHKIIIDAVARKENIDIENVNENTKTTNMTKIEGKLQQRDRDLIHHIQNSVGEEQWNEIIKKARNKDKKVFLTNDDIKIEVPDTFSQGFFRPPALGI